MACEKDKKQAGNKFFGIDKSTSDFTMLASAPIIVTKVVQPLYKKAGYGYIGTKEPLNSRDVIRVGRNQISYRIMTTVSMIKGGGYLHRVKRTDGYGITRIDVEAIKEGDRVQITNRRPFDKAFAQSLKPYES